MFSHATPFSCVARATIARGVCGIAVAASLSACLAGCGSLSLGGGNPSPDPGKGVEQPFKDPKKGMGGGSSDGSGVTPTTDPVDDQVQPSQETFYFTVSAPSGDGYIVVDQEGNQAFDPGDYEIVGNASEGLVLVRWQTEGAYDDNWNVTTGLQEHWGYLDMQGNLAINLDDLIAKIYGDGVKATDVMTNNTRTTDFKNGRAFVDFNDDGLKVMIDSSGNIMSYAGYPVSDSQPKPLDGVIDPNNGRSFSALGFENGYLVCDLSANYSSCLMDKDGNVVTTIDGTEPYCYNDQYYMRDVPGVGGRGVYDFSGNLLTSEAQIQQDGGFDSVSFEGNMVVGSPIIIVDVAKDFDTGDGGMEHREAWGFLDVTTGQFVGDLHHESFADEFDNGFITGTAEGGFLVQANGGSGILGTDGQWVLEPGHLFANGDMASSDLTDYNDDYYSFRGASGDDELIRKDDLDGMPVVIPSGARQ